VTSRREARIARRLADEIRQKEKSARLVVRVGDEPKVRQGANPASIYDMQMRWSAGSADRDGDWPWGARDWTQSAWDGVILPKLKNFETMMWKEIEASTTDNGHKSHHDMPTERICEDAQCRLIELNHEEEDIYRFRLGNKRRLWGFRIVNEFSILWYDPEHRIYPTDPD